MNYDIIGDIHGHADSLLALLRKLGYRKVDGAWRQTGHTAIFVGDFIDRGPQQLETLAIVHAMVDSGAALAVMGNHEFNAIAWHAPDPRNPGTYLRGHSEKNRKQHQAFLDATANKPELREEWLDWFLTLPLWLDLPELRVVHACWHPTCMDTLAPQLEPEQRLNMALVEAASRRGSPQFDAVEAILKGPEASLPNGLSFTLGGELRHEARTRWWDANAVTFCQSAIVDAASRPLLPDTPIPAELRFGYQGDKPVFNGHYWMTGEPQLLAPRVACVDYSAGRGGPLVAYRWRGEQDLDSHHFVSA